MYPTILSHSISQNMSTYKDQGATRGIQMCWNAMGFLVVNEIFMKGYEYQIIALWTHKKYWRG